jgi:hypothetical protein
MKYLGAWGTLIHEKNLKSKISCQTPFKSCTVGRGKWGMIASLLIKPSPFPSLWGGSVSVDLFL